MTLWAEQEARRRGLSDPEYVRYQHAERQVQEAMARFDEQVAAWGRKVTQGRVDRL